LRVATPTYAGQSGGQEARSLEDILWYALCAFLILACVVVLGYWLYRIANGQVDRSRMLVMVLLVLIYALCVFCGWWWGKAQSVPVQEELRQHAAGLQQQVEGLQQNIEYLTRENQTLQQQARQRGKLAAGDSGIAARPVQAVQTPPQAPPGSIYEEQREPTDSSDLALHPHEKRFPAPGEANSLDHNWCLIAASRRGYGHGYEGKYREDDFQIKILNNQAVGPALAVVALADGVSSKGLSRKGALASVEGATALTEQQVTRLKAFLYHNSSLEDVRAAATAVLLDALRGAAEAVKRVSLTEQIPLDELHATLLVFLAAALGPDQLFLARVQIGDGAMFGVRTGANESNESPRARWRQLLAPQIQAAGNEVQPFMRSQEKDWLQYMQFDILSSIGGVMAMTDGIADDVEPPAPRPGEPEPDHFSMVDRFHQTYVIPTLQAPRPADELVRFIGYRRAQSLDDRTLVYLYHK
jgi:cell division protein FtsB